jgi:two-component system, NarL family, response regulator YdfI
MIRVQIRASSAVARAGLESLLQNHPSLRILRTAFDGDEAAADDEAEEVEPDVIVAELQSRDDGVLADVRSAAANSIPVVLLVPGSAAEWADMLRQGVKAILPANATGAQIAAATEAAAAGLVVLDPAEVESLLQTPPANEAPVAPPEALTAREIEVLRLVAEGLANKEVAARLGVSEHTVKFHVASIMGKLGAASRTEAVMLGIRHGLVLI